MKEGFLWIDGERRKAGSGRWITVIDPGKGEEIGRMPVAAKDDVGAAVEAAQRALKAPEWAEMAPAERGRRLAAWGALVRERQDALAECLSLENGKPLAHARGEIDTTAEYFRYYGGWADKIYSRVVPTDPSISTVVLREPLGVIAHIIPWNYPADIFARGVAPCLAMGNTVVVKPAENTSSIALELALLGQDAGIPDGVVNVVTGDGEETGAALAAHPDLDAIAFCGSIRGGKAVMHAAAETLVPVVSLELGGKSASIVLPDADAAAAASGGAWGICYNTGQSCGARSRLLVPVERVPEAVEAAVEAFRSLKVGYWNDDVFMGPLISEAQLERVAGFVNKGIDEGAKLECGGKRIDRPGFFFEPTLFSGVRPGMTLADEEVFGPVLAIMGYEDEEDAFRIADASSYGLSAAIVTGDSDKADRLARRLDVSHVSINNAGNFGIDTPFGGVRKSGYGREGGVEALYQYSRVKAVSWRK